MEKRCPSCGAIVAPNTAQCPSCGAIIATRNGLMSNVYSVAGAILALILALLCMITNFVDSATIFNRMYTTALEWNVPFATIILIILGFVVSHKKNRSLFLNFVSVILLAIAFIFSNVNKNMVQDHVSNIDNYVGIAAEAMDDNAEHVVDWMDTIEDSAKGVEREIEREYRY